MGLFARGMYAVVSRWASVTGLQPEDGSDKAEAGRQRRQAGLKGEILAYWFLRRQGYVVIRRNYRSRHLRGEVDLIGWDGSVLAFVEVKTRTTEKGNPPEVAVDAAKRRFLDRMARGYLRRRGWADVRYRFDVVAIDASPGKPPVVRLHQGAFLP